MILIKLISNSRFPFEKPAKNIVGGRCEERIFVQIPAKTFVIFFWYTGISEAFRKRLSALSPGAQLIGKNVAALGSLSTGPTTIEQQIQ